MRPRPRWGAALVTVLLLAMAETSRADDTGEIRVRELWIPWEEFLRHRDADPESIILKLDEYRALVLAGHAHADVEPPPDLPPVDAVIEAAEHRATLVGRTIRVQSSYDLRVTRDGWVRCPLWPLPPRLGRVTVDDQPAWIVVGRRESDTTTPPLPCRHTLRAGDSFPKLAAKFYGDANLAPQIQAANANTPMEPGRVLTIPEPPGGALVESFLLYRGRGAHRLDLEFSIPISESDDRLRIESLIPRAQSAHFLLDLPGRVEATASPALLETRVAEDGASTSLRLAIGSESSFQLEWRTARTLSESGALLAARHELSAWPRLGNPLFEQRTEIDIWRRKLSELVLLEAPGTRVVDVEGDAVQSWMRSPDDDGGPHRITLRLDTPRLGTVSLLVRGVLLPETPADGEESSSRTLLGVPLVVGADSDTGHVVVAAARDERVVVDAGGLREAEPRETSTSFGTEALGEWLFANAESRLDIRTSLVPLRLESRAACWLNVEDEVTRLDAVFRVDVLDGRLYRLSVELPEPWTLESVEALRRADGKIPQLRHTLRDAEAAAARRIELETLRATTSGSALEFRITARDSTAATAGDADIGTRDLALSLPRAIEASRQELHLAVATSNSLLTEIPEQPGWSARSVEQLAEFGLTAPDDGLGLVAGLSRTDTGEPAAATVSMRLTRRAPRGEYQALTRLLIVEDHWRVRTDLRLGVIDRGLESIDLHLPVPVDTTTHIFGEGIRETPRVASPDGGSVHSVRWAKPWLGTRELRIEYELDAALWPRAPGGAGATPAYRVPWMEIAETSENSVDRRFHGERSILFQSDGAIQLVVSDGDELLPVELDNLPELGDEWPVGRQLFARRFRALGGASLPATARPASFLVESFERAETLHAVVRELRLTTTLDASGASRTRAEFDIAREDARGAWNVKLPADATLLEAWVDDGTALPVRRTPNESEWQLQLPPRTYAGLILIYQRTRAELSAWGDFREAGPSFGDVPVLATKWTTYYPAGFRFVPLEGALAAGTSSTAPPEDGEFVSRVLGRLIRGLPPRFRILEPLRTRLPYSVAGRAGWSADAIASARQIGPAIVQSANTAQQVEWLQATVEQQAPIEKGQQLHGEPREGFRLELEKIGGDPELALTFRQVAFERFAVRTVFLLTILIGIVLAVFARRRVFYRFVLVGGIVAALAGQVLWLTIGRGSPLVFDPICEALLVLLVVALVCEGLLWIAARCSRRKARSAVTAFVSASTLLTAAALCAQEAEHSVLIPYDPDELSTAGVEAGDGGETDPRRAWVPSELYEELWRRAHPDGETSDGAQDLGAGVAIGNAEYRLTLDGARFLLSGSIDLEVLVDEWIALPLDFDGARLAEVRLDGTPTGLAQDDGVPTLSFRGKGTRRLELDLVGRVENSPTGASLRSSLFGGRALRVSATLPPGARPVVDGEQAGLQVDSTEEATTVTLDLGASGDLGLAWTLPSVDVERAAQIESIAACLLRLSLDGYSIERRERVRVASARVDALQYELLGDWQVRSVTGAQLTEWEVVEATNEAPRQLRLYFAQPVDRADLVVQGWAPLGDTPPSEQGPGALKQVASLELSGAIRQETWFALWAGSGRRWLPELLGVNRVGTSELSSVLDISQTGEPDWAYHVFDSAKGRGIAAESETATVDVESEALVHVLPDRATITSRTRYRVRGAGPLHQTVLLPSGWAVRHVEGDTVRDWRTATEAGGTRLSIDLSSRATTGGAVTWSAERRQIDRTQAFTVPVLRTETPGTPIRSERVTLSLAAAEDLELAEQTAVGVESLPDAAIPRWVELPTGSTYRFGVRSSGRTPQYDLAFRVRGASSSLDAMSVCVVRAEERFLEVNSRVIVKVEGGGRSSFRFRLPPGATSADLRTRNRRSLSSLTDSELSVELISRVVGEHAFDITFRLPRPLDGSPIDLSAIRTLDGDRVVQERSSWVGVLALGTTGARVAAAEHLLPVEASELPALPSGVAVPSLRSMYSASRSDWRLRIETEALETVDSLALQVELAEITTQIGRDGTRRTRVLYTLRNRKLQFLSVQLPEGARLWGATLGGLPVVVSRIDGRLQIPLEFVGDDDIDLEVGLTYSEPRIDLGGFGGHLDFVAPRILSDGTSTNEIAITRTLWNFDLPDGYSAVLADGNVRAVPAGTEYASKVETILEQVERVSQKLESASTPEAGKKSVRMTKRQRSRAESRLKELQQALSDNIIDLEETLEQAPLSEQAQSIDKDSLQRFDLYNRSLLQRGREGQTAVANTLQSTKEEESSTRSPSDQAFEDRRNFLGNRWQEQRVDGKGGAKSPSGRPTSKNALERLLGEAGFEGYRRDVEETHVAAQKAATASRVEESRLEPLDRPTLEAVHPALETPPVDPSRSRLSYRRDGGGAEVRLRLVRSGLWPRWIASGVLVVLLVGLGLRALTGRRRR